MALPVREQLTYWGIAAAALLLTLWLLGDVLLPFVVGAAIAYFLDPVADRLEGMGMSRVWATITITAFAVIAFIVVAVIFVPTLVQQATDLVRTTPALFESLQSYLRERFPDLFEGDSMLRRTMVDLIEVARERGAELANRLLGSALSIVNVLMLVILVPVITFYLLLDWDRMIARVDALLPRDHAPTIRRIAREIDETLAGFVRGQGTVCAILGAYYAIALMLVGLQFGLVVGVIAGALTFIPYVGAIVGGILAIGLAMFQFWGEWHMIIIVWAIFQSGQFAEGNFLTPKMVGSSVGLHPVTLILALSVFGSLFGFVGVLVAVPAAAVIGVIVRFLTEQYKQGRLYRGLNNLADEE